MNWQPTLNEIADAAHNNAIAKGFHDDGLTDAQFIERHANLLHEEVSELFSAVRTDQWDKPCDKADKMIALGIPPLTCAEEELADIIIRVLDQCRRLRLDPERIVLAKHRYNTTRPHKHGKKF